MKRGWKRYLAGMAGLMMVFSTNYGAMLGSQIVMADDVEIVPNGGVENVYEAKPIFVGESITIEEEPEIEIGQGRLTEENARYEYQFTAPREGYYYIELVTEPQTRASCGIYDEFGEKKLGLCTDYEYDADPVYFYADETYKFEITRYQNDNTDFKVTIKSPKETIDVSAVSEIKDQVTFPIQRNRYLFTANKSGWYHFIPDCDVDLTMDLWDAEDSSIYLIDTYMNNVSGIGNAIVYLEEGHQYVISIKKYSTDSYALLNRRNDPKSKYTLNIFMPKEEKDITGYTKIAERFEHLRQSIYYKFTAPEDGMYTLDFETKNGMSLYVVVNNKQYGNDNLWDDYHHSIMMDKGQEYTIILTQFKGMSNFNLNITYPDSAEDFLKSFSSGETEEKTNTSAETDKEYAELQKENEQVKAENEALQSQVDDLQSKYDQIMEMLAAKGMEVE